MRKYLLRTRFTGSKNYPQNEPIRTGLQKWTNPNTWQISPLNTFQWIKMPLALNFIMVTLVRTNYDCWLDHVIVFVTWWKSISVIWLHVCLSCSVRFFILDLKNFLSTAAAHFRLYTAPQAVIIKILKQIIIKKLKKGQIQIQVVFVGWNPSWTRVYIVCIKISYE